MLKSQKHSVRLSEIRGRLSAIAGLAGDAITEAVTKECDDLRQELGAVETQYRAAVLAEDTKDIEIDNTGEGAEAARLRGRARCGEFMRSALQGVLPGGAEKEYTAALKMAAMGASGGIMIPWPIMEAEPDRSLVGRQDRADAVSSTTILDGGVTQRSLLQRLFGASILTPCGIRIDDAGAGQTEYPLLTGGATAEQVAEHTEKATEVFTVTTATLKPKSLRVGYKWTAEMSAQIPAIESNLRRDSTAAIRAAMSIQAIGGTGVAPQVKGLFTTLAQAGAAPADVATLGDVIGAPSLAVDGVHASNIGEVTFVSPVDLYRFISSLSATTGDVPALERLGARVGSFMASGFLPDAPTSGTFEKVTDALLHANGGETMRGDSIAAMWGGGAEAIRDPYTGATEGTTRLILAVLWDLYAAFRADAYKRVHFRLAT